jgi:penicillin-binding protein 2
MSSQPVFTSMFQRRLALLYALIALAMLLVVGQLTRLTVVEGADRLRQAERPLVRERWIPTQRGRILDRTGRVLAEDRPAYDILVDYPMITGVWAYEQAARQARREHRERWPELSRAERDALIERYAPAWRVELAGMWEILAGIGGVDRATLESRRGDIVQRVQRAATTIWERRRLERQREWARERETAREITLSEVARPIREQTEPHVILRNVSDEAAFDARRLGERFEGVIVRDGGARAYPLETMTVQVDRSTFPSPLRDAWPVEITVPGVATHLVGWMRDQVYASDVEARPKYDAATGQLDRGHYQSGDSVGTAGVEVAYEGTLRGLRGVETIHRDTGEEEILPALDGSDVTLTIDAALQAHVQALFDPSLGLAVVQPWHEHQELEVGTTLAAAAVVVEIATGDVLAAATGPSFTRRDLDERPEWVFESPIEQPWVDRSMARPYAPASIVKPLTLAEAVGKGKHALDHLIACNGHFLENRDDILRCWIYRPRFGMMTHSMQLGGPLNGAQSISHSCNIYFYTLGRLLGPSGMSEMYRTLGVVTGLDVGVETAPGSIGAPGQANVEIWDATMMAMGQGPVTWTPLHSANAYAALARGGVWMEPRVVTSIEQSGERVRSLGWPRAAIDEAIEGLAGSIDEPTGTSHHLTIDGRQEPIFNHTHLRVVGKTGTGQSPPTMHDPDGDGPLGPEVVRTGDNAWTTILVGRKGGPFEFAISVVVEHGGSGGRVAGPIANQVVHALIDEGYLPPAPSAGGSS